jgi:glycosyltransferase involved in cell wall biosynthesis
MTASTAAGANATENGPSMTCRVSVVVSTMNRPDQIVECVRSVLANPGARFELVVVDQSDRAVTDRALASVGHDARLRWVVTETRGLSASRNVGISATRAPIVAFTDDDCRVPDDWVARIETAFAADEQLALLFGAVVLRPEDRLKGYAAEFEPTETREFHRKLPDVRSSWGVGANMSIRRAVFDQIGMFDLMLGAGSSFRAGEEIDLTIRALNAGLKVFHDPSIAVIHLGVREGPAASRLMRGYGIGLGATLTKHVRLGTRGAGRLLAQWLLIHGRRSVSNAIRLHRNPGLGLVGSVVWGACRSFELRVDKSSNVYLARR